MKILLKNGYVSLQDPGYIYDRDIEIPIEGYNPQKRYVYQINNLPKTPANNGIVVIPKELLKTTGVLIEVEIQEGLKKEIYKSDQINFRKATLIGEDPEDCFPASLKEIKTDINTLKAGLFDLLTAVKNLEERIINLEEEGDLI